MAARKGAKLVLAARSGEALDRLAAEIKAQGSEAIAVVTDVGHEERVERLAKAAIAVFGRFDTSVNNAGVSIFGRCLDVSVEDTKRMFDINF